MTVQEWLGEDNQLGIDIWEKKYRDNNENLDQHIHRLANKNPILHRLIEDKKFMFGGRTTANRGTAKKASMMNCYSRGFVGDSLDDILQVNTDIGLTFKTQGGQGLSLSKLRPKGCGINGGQFQSDGIIPFMELYNRTTESISQGGSRKGALLMGLDIWHKEAADFITIKSEEGRIQKANLSLEIDDEFMECIKKYYETGEVITKHIVRDYSNNRVEYDVVPIKLYKLMMGKAYDWGEPGCIFTNRFRNYNLMEFCPDYNIEICNPCVTSDTKVLTDKGHYPIKDLIEKPISIWNGYKFSQVIPKLTAKSQELMEVTFSNGSKLRCTPYHKFILKNDERVECKDLKLGDKIQKCEMPVINGSKEIENAYTQGFYSGDGYECKDRNYKYISFYGEHKKPLVKYCATINQRENCAERLTYSVDVKYPKDFVPVNDYSVKSKIEWLAGIVDSDGSNNVDGSICITSVNFKFIEDIFYMLETIGVSATYNKCREEESRKFPESMGNKVYHTQNLYRVCISASDVLKLNKLGFEPHRVSNSCIPNRDAKRYIEVTQVIELSQKEDVYCFTENSNHSGIFNGVLTAQCGEQPLGKNSACDLGSINLSEFVIDPFVETARFDFDDFAVAIDEGIRALDEIIDENKDNHALEAQKEMSLNYRNVGLGVMGMWDMLCKLNITYGSQDSKCFIDSLMGFMFRRAVIASSRLAKEKGAFPKYSSKLLEAKIFKKHFSDDDIKLLEIDKYGLRNCSLLSIAPTGSIGTMLNISTGCEPAFQISYRRKTESLNNGQEVYYDVYTGLAREYMKKYNTENLPETFKTAADIHWKDRIDIQAILQEHVDTAISSTVNLPNNIKLEEIEKLYLYAWEKGLKGVTIYRDGCRRQGILNTKNHKEDQDIIAEDELPRGYILKTTDDMPSFQRNVVNGCGDFTIHLDFDDFTGKPYQSWIDLGDGGCERNLQYISRLISTCLRSGVPLSEVIRQAKKVRPCASYMNRKNKHGDVSKGTSCPSAIGYALEDLQKQISDIGGYEYNTEEHPAVTVNIKKTNSGDRELNICPECGEELIFEGGCNICKSCGWSKCD